MKVMLSRDWSYQALIQLIALPLYLVDRHWGVTYQRPENDRYNYSEEYLRGKIIGVPGGRLAEEVVFENKTTGAENDIEVATKLARNMVTRWRMSEKIGIVE